MNKINEATTPHIRHESISSSTFLASLRITMRKASQDQVDALNAHLDLHPDPRELEYFVGEHTAELKAKDTTNAIKHHMISAINALIQWVHKMAIQLKNQWTAHLIDSMNWKRKRRKWNVTFKIQSTRKLKKPSKMYSKAMRHSNRKSKMPSDPYYTSKT